MNKDRRQQILGLWGEGLTRREIVERTGLPYTTVEYYLRGPKAYCRVYTRQMSVAVDPEMHDALQTYAEKNGMSLPEAVRTFCQWGLDAD